MKLTAIIICRSRKDKELNKALKSIEFVDEILVIEHLEINDYADVRNQALDKAKGEWVLFLDSDEEIGGELKREILETLDKNYNISGAYFKRRDRFLGKWLRHGETAGVNLLRLARKGAGKWERPVHEVWKIEGKIVEMKNPLLHYSHETIEEMVEKLDRYSEMEAEYKNRQIDKYTNRQMAKWLIMVQMVINPAGKFILNYFFRLGFLDGMEGFIHAGMMSGHSFLVRGKIINALMR